MSPDATKKPPTAVTTDQQELEDQIRLRAYELYEERGREDGYAEEDWLRAKEGSPGSYLTMKWQQGEFSRTNLPLTPGSSGNKKLLYFRLSTVTLKVPPLRERRADIVMLADHFLRNYAGKRARAAPRLSGECEQLLLAYHFPGNVRELEGEMARLVAMCSPGEEIPASGLSDRIARRKATAQRQADIQPMSLAEMEKN